MIDPMRLLVVMISSWINYWLNLALQSRQPLVTVYPSLAQYVPGGHVDEILIDNIKVVFPLKIKVANRNYEIYNMVIY